MPTTVRLWHQDDSSPFASRGLRSPVGHPRGHLPYVRHRDPCEIAPRKRLDSPPISRHRLGIFSKYLVRQFVSSVRLGARLVSLNPDAVLIRRIHRTQDIGLVSSNAAPLSESTAAHH